MFSFKRKKEVHISKPESVREVYERAISCLPRQRQKHIHELVAKELIQRNPIGNNRVFWTGKGDDLFYETIYGMRFYSSFHIIESSFKKINDCFKRGEKKVPLTDLYDEWNLKYPSSIRALYFTEPIRYEIKVVEEDDNVNNVIFFVNHPKQIL